MQRVLPVGAIVPAFPAGTFRRYRGTTTASGVKSAMEERPRRKTTCRLAASAGTRLWIGASGLYIGSQRHVGPPPNV